MVSWIVSPMSWALRQCRWMTLPVPFREAHKLKGTFSRSLLTSTILDKFHIFRSRRSVSFLGFRLAPAAMEKNQSNIMMKRFMLNCDSLLSQLSSRTQGPSWLILCIIRIRYANERWIAICDSGPPSHSPPPPPWCWCGCPRWIYRIHEKNIMDQFESMLNN